MKLITQMFADTDVFFTERKRLVYQINPVLWPVRGLPRPLPNDSWDGLQPP